MNDPDVVVALLDAAAFLLGVHVRVQRQRAGEASPLAHAAADFGGKLVEGVLHPDQA